MKQRLQQFYINNLIPIFIFSIVFDDVPNDFLKYLDPLALKWFLQPYNSCWANKTIPKLWLKAKVVAVSKPGESGDDGKNYRKISLLCFPFELYERIILKKL